MTSTILLLSTAWLSQTPAPAAEPATEPAVGAPRIETADSFAHQLGLELRCPVCQGMPIAESPSQMAQDMMVQVRKLVAEGKSRDEILDYFAGRYGDWVLLNPRAEGMNLGLWVLPAMALLVGLVLVVSYVRKSQASKPAGDGATTKSDAPPGPGDEDPYLAELRKQVGR